MLYKFKSKAAGDLIMTAPVGDRMMALVGRAPAAQGIFLVAQMPAAIAALEQGIADEEHARREAEAEAAAEGRTLPPPKDVSLRQRAWPLIEMLKRAHEADKDVVWGV
ncbi:DUF1840 domain-containing protein [Sphaerotilus sp.]|uniref:DUF1840 domain-containing protein n=1 Tax=Sphaerotilus sp. TaxID=2093942 RepID=UPI0034E2944D